MDLIVTNLLRDNIKDHTNAKKLFLIQIGKAIIVISLLAIQSFLMSYGFMINFDHINGVISAIEKKVLKRIKIIMTKQSFKLNLPNLPFD
jgi:hypothetical protein